VAFTCHANTLSNLISAKLLLACSNPQVIDTMNMRLTMGSRYSSMHVGINVDILMILDNMSIIISAFDNHVTMRTLYLAHLQCVSHSLN
jgi:hypothetical protein